MFMRFIHFIACDVLICISALYSIVWMWHNLSMLVSMNIWELGFYKWILVHAFDAHMLAFVLGTQEQNCSVTGYAKRLYQFTLPITVYMCSGCSTFLPTLDTACYFHFNSDDGCVVRYIVDFTELSLMNTECVYLFICLLAIWIAFFVKYLFKAFVHWVVCCLLVDL